MWRTLAAASAAALALWSVRVISRPAVFWGQFHGVPPERVIYAEDGTGLAVLTSPDPFFRRRADVFVNGLGQSTIPFGGVHTYLGLVPALLHPAPRRIAVIGLGSGDTAYAASFRRETEEVHCVEIIGGQVRTLRALHQRTGYPGVGQLLADPRLRLVTGDGRRYLMRSDTRFDIIEADALRPGSAYAGHLYSKEYFELLRSRLAEGGLAVTWAPTPRIERTFALVFPHVASVLPMLIGSNTPIVFDRAAIRDRASDPNAHAHFNRAGLSLGEQLEQLLSTFEPRPQRQVPPDESMLNTDLFPRDELRTPTHALQD